MTAVLGSILLLLATASLVVLPRRLADAAWPTRAPATALLLWQASFVTGLLALAGAAVLLGLRPLQADVPHALVEFVHGHLAVDLSGAGGVVSLVVLILTAGASAAIALCLFGELRARARVRRHQRTLVDLLGTRSPEWPGVDVIDYPVAAAYSVPGRRWRVVVTRPLLEELTPAQVRAVLAHEHAHAAQRHHWVTLLFSVASRCRLPRARRCYDEVRGLLEMCADDAVRSSHGNRTLASALVHLSRASAQTTSPSGSFGVADRLALDRVQRLIAPSPRPRWLPPLGSLAAAGLLAGPLVAIAVPCLTS